MDGRAGGEALRGETAVSRAGLSLLSNLGLPELVAYSQDQYVQGGRRPGQKKISAPGRPPGGTAGERMLQSPLMGRARFARDVEAAYREMVAVVLPMMLQMTTEQTIQLGLQHHQSGRLGEAERAYRHVLSQAPGQPDALHLLGL